MDRLVGATRALVYLGGTAVGAALVFIGWWLSAQPRRYTATASGTYTSAENAERRFFERDGREYQYWVSSVGVEFEVNRVKYAFRERFRVYDSALLPSRGGLVDVRYDASNPAVATTRAILGDERPPAAPIFLIVVGLALIAVVNAIMIKAGGARV